MKLPGAVASKIVLAERWRIVGIQPGLRTPSIMSTWPDAKASVRAVVSAMKRDVDVLRGRRPGEVSGKAVRQDAFGRADALDLVGARADRAHGEVGALLLEGLAAEDRCREGRDDAAVEQRIGPFEREAHRAGDRAPSTDVDVGIERLLVGDDLRIEMPCEGEDDVVGRHLAIALVELHPAAQFVGPGLRIRGALPALGEIWAEVLGPDGKGSVVRFDEGVEDLTDGPVVAAGQSRLLRVDAGRASETRARS